MKLEDLATVTTLNEKRNMYVMHRALVHNDLSSSVSIEIGGRKYDISMKEQIGPFIIKELDNKIGELDAALASFGVYTEPSDDVPTDTVLLNDQVQAFMQTPVGHGTAGDADDIALALRKAGISAEHAETILRRICGTNQPVAVSGEQLFKTYKASMLPRSMAEWFELTREVQERWNLTASGVALKPAAPGVIEALK